MIALVLHDAGVKSGRLACDRPPLRIEALVAHAGEARHDTAQARNRQAPLPAVLQRRRERRDPRIDDFGVRHRLGVGIALVRLEAEDDDAKTDADLGRREPGAVLRGHRVAHVGEQRVELGCGELLDRARRREQPRIAHAQDVADHRGSSRRRRRRKRE